MRRRIHHAPQVRAVLIDKATKLVTLEDPAAGAESARGAFARLRPPEGATGEQTSAWRNVVSAVALAVRVIPGPQAALVPAGSERAGETVGTLREEALELARETGDPQVEALTRTILDQVGA